MKYDHEVHPFGFWVTAYVYAVPDHIEDDSDDPCIPPKTWKLPFWKWLFNHKEYVRYKLWAIQEAHAWARERIYELKEDDRIFNLQMKFNNHGNKTYKQNF